MLEEIHSLKQTINTNLSEIKNSEGLESFKLEFLVKKGKIQLLFDRFKRSAKRRETGCRQSFERTPCVCRTGISKAERNYGDRETVATGYRPDFAR